MKEGAFTKKGYLFDVDDDLFQIIQCTLACFIVEQPCNYLILPEKQGQNQLKLRLSILEETVTSQTHWDVLGVVTS